MNKKIHTEVNIGIDTSQTQLDIYVRPCGDYFSVENTPKGAKENRGRTAVYHNRGSTPVFVIAVRPLFSVFCFPVFCFPLSATVSGTCNCHLFQGPDCSDSLHSFKLRRRNAFPMTDTELRLMAAAAIIGLNNKPNTGYKTPAAIGIPATL
jgi:hypothetical protein